MNGRLTCSPFAFEVPNNTPVSVVLQPTSDDEVPCGVEYELSGESVETLITFQLLVSSAPLPPFFRHNGRINFFTKVRLHLEFVAPL